MALKLMAWNLTCKMLLIFIATKYYYERNAKYYADINDANNVLVSQDIFANARLILKL